MSKKEQQDQEYANVLLESEKLIGESDPNKLTEGLTTVLINSQEPDSRDMSKAGVITESLSEQSKNQISAVIDKIERKPSWLEKIGTKIQKFIGWLLGNKDKIPNPALKNIAEKLDQVADLNEKRKNSVSLEQVTKPQEVNESKLIQELKDKISALEKQNADLLEQNKALQEKLNQQPSLVQVQNPNIPQPPKLNIPQAPVLPGGGIPQAPKLNIPQAPALPAGGIPKAPALSQKPQQGPKQEIKTNQQSNNNTKVATINPADLTSAIKNLKKVNTNEKIQESNPQMGLQDQLFQAIKARRQALTKGARKSSDSDIEL